MLVRHPEELLASALKVLDAAFDCEIRKPVRGKPNCYLSLRPYAIAPLFSGGHDSSCAVHVASRHPRFAGVVHHIDTGIGSKRTREHVERVCRDFGWGLKVYKSKSTYETFVRQRGFPGPGMHQRAYIRLKDRCVEDIVRGKLIVLVTGCRSQESVRRMGHVEPVKWGEWANNAKTGQKERIKINRVWSAPCHDWSSEEQRAYMEHFDIPENPVKMTLGMSGECLCGSFAQPGELERVRRHCPDVAAEIDRLAVIARQCGKHDKWGTRPPTEKGVVAVESGPLCSSCDLRAKAAGIVFKSECGATSSGQTH